MLVRFLVLSLLFFNAKFGYCLQCTDVFNSQKSNAFFELKLNEFLSQHQLSEKITIRFVSQSGKKLQFTATHLLGKSASKTYLSEDQKYVIKVYPPYNVLPQHEVLATRFFLENNYPVNEVLDYSNNVFKKDKNFIYVVKPYVPGLNSMDSITVSRNRNAFPVGVEDLSKKIHNYILLVKKYKKWVRKQPEYFSIMLFVETSPLYKYADLKRRNWLLVADGTWVLIDP